MFSPQNHMKISQYGIKILNDINFEQFSCCDNQKGHSYSLVCPFEIILPYMVTPYISVTQ